MSNEELPLDDFNIKLDDKLIEEGLTFGASHSAEAMEFLNEFVNNVFNKGMVVQDALGMDDSKIENFYNKAYQLYQGGKYVEASHLFRTLIFLKNSDMRFAFGLASCFHMLKEYHHAAEAYLKCSLLDTQDPMPFYHASDCYLKMDNPEAALLMLHMVLQKIGNQKQHHQLKDKVLLAIDSLQEQAG